MVQAALPGGLEAAGDLTDDAPGLFGGQRTQAQDRGQGLRVVHPLLDEVGVAVLGADVQDADQPAVLDPCGASGGIQDAGAVRVLGVDDGQIDVASERGVVGGPALDVAPLPEAPAQRVATSEDRSWAYALHPRSLSAAHLVLVRVPILGCAQRPGRTRRTRSRTGETRSSISRTRSLRAKRT